ncbi:hypothetical protein [Kingella sp. (in: b-proteobacteria)]|uniref:hypothetical protein n=1 Tax=Kingella sp. (in: b-proteobacteria) TaxID=2020713 RepID=UPI0026DB8D51|nr:hypothetical protein [Kingella sp. (in: b-proteobacteria)]MDO4656520.1 hypothetical protein [Kingella sp. (in: b-proteobacteria)]
MKKAIVCAVLSLGLLSAGAQAHDMDMKSDMGMEQPMMNDNKMEQPMMHKSSSKKTMMKKRAMHGKGKQSMRKGGMHKHM